MKLIRFKDNIKGMCDRMQKRQRCNTTFSNIVTYDLQQANVICSSAPRYTVAKFTVVNGTQRFIIIDRRMFESSMTLDTLRDDGSWWDEFNGTEHLTQSQYFLQYDDTPLCTYVFANDDRTVFEFISECIYRH